jgi:hypothetical protein
MILGIGIIHIVSIRVWIAETSRSTNPLRLEILHIIRRELILSVVWRIGWRTCTINLVWVVETSRSTNPLRLEILYIIRRELILSVVWRIGWRTRTRNCSRRSISGLLRVVFVIVKIFGEIPKGTSGTRCWHCSI